MCQVYSSLFFDDVYIWSSTVTDQTLGVKNYVEGECCLGFKE